MKSKVKFFTITLLLLHSLFGNGTSLQGYTGLLHIPNGNIQPYGWATFMINNFEGRTNRVISQYETQNYLLNLHILPYCEISGRFYHAMGDEIAPRDLSANIKIAYPLQKHHRYLPNIAFGIQDISGGANYFKSKYIALSEKIAPFDITIGYGFHSKILDGFFGGLEVDLNKHLSFLLEYDTKDLNGAFKFNVFNQESHIPFGLSFLVMSTLRKDFDKVFFGISLNSNLSPTLPIDSISVIKKVKTITFTTTEQIENKLSKMGFAQIDVYERQDTLICHYENIRYNHNDLDAVGVVLGIMTGFTNKNINHLQIFSYKHNLPVFSVIANKKQYQQFLHTGKIAPLKIVLKHSNSYYDYQKHKNRGYTGLFRLALSPRLIYAIGTELGPFDYQLSLNTDFDIQLWPGAVISSRTIIPLYHTSNYDDGQYFSVYRNNFRLEQVNLHQFFSTQQGIGAHLSVGYLDQYLKYITACAELQWKPWKTNHTIKTYLGTYTRRGGIVRGSFLGSYGYTIAPWDLTLSLTGGRFFHNDEGVIAEVKKEYRNSSFAMALKITNGKNNYRNIFARASLTVPFSLRKSIKPSVVAIRGVNEWRNSLQIRVVRDGEPGYWSNSTGVIKKPLRTLDKDFYNKDRLSNSYFYKNLSLLRDAYMNFVEK